MYLVDTSVWIDYLREFDNPPARHFASLLDQDIPFGLTGIIYQEVLQGAATVDDFKSLKEYLGTQQFFEHENDLQSHQEAAEIYFNCRRKGITIRSTIDCLIAQVAIEHNLILLHNDEDYVRIASVVPQLKLYPNKTGSVVYQIHEPLD